MNSIAVLLPVYGGDNSEYLEKAIESILSQTYNNIDLIILADGPLNHKLARVIQGVEKQLKIVIRNEKNKGLAHILNRGVEYCLERNYNFIGRMDADDLSMTERFQKQIEYLLAHPEIDVVGGAIEEIDSQGNRRDKVIKYPIAHEECFRFFAKRDPLAHPAVLFRKSYFEKAGLYDEGFRKNQDTQLWFHGFKNQCQFANIPEVVLQLRMNDDFFKSRRGGYKRALKIFKQRSHINRELGYGVGARLFALGMFLLTISPAGIRKLAYTYLR
jgi:glycosyltransferase involved in cell wall biosynthesis